MKKDSPGVRIPPPLYYASFFMLSFILQGYFTIRRAYFFHSPVANIIGILIIITALIMIVPAILQFIRSKNTIVPMKPATSLQVSGIYSVTRNPMYLGLMLLYLGLALIFGNWWTLFLMPLLMAVVTYRIIIPEEKYLGRAFGNSYTDYKKMVRRWI